MTHPNLPLNATPDPQTHVLRVGRRALRTLYIQGLDDRDDEGYLIGVVDTPYLAEQIVEAWERDGGRR